MSMASMYRVPLLVVQSTAMMKDQGVDGVRGGVVCTLGEWCMPLCSVLGSVNSIPTWVLRKVSRDSLRQLSCTCTCSDLNIIKSLVQLASF